MKKSTLIVVSAAAMLFLAACSGNKPGAESSEPATSQKESAHKHSYGEWTQTKAPTCTEKGEKERTCTGCGEKQTQAVSAAGHNYVKDDAKSQDATCTEGGKLVEKCSVCGNEKETATEALDHDLVKAEDQTGAVNPTCTEAGTEIDECSRCHEKVTVDVRATGHTLEHSDEKSVAPTCDNPGKDVSVCSVCSAEEETVVEKLGHALELVGGEITPEEGKAAVRLYTCTREGCDTEYMGFKANEVSAASKETLVIDEETGGARFFGQPIGNKCDLDPATGDPAEDAEPVPDSSIKGDFFEYVFDLTEEQAAKLSTCKMYCEATAAQWMSNNRMDFWAINSGDVDWTKGCYIETTDSHQEGEQITDYRYILYVDDEVQEFDPSVRVPAKSNNQKAEYELPYTFHLHAGTNKIRLVMAGGYRSTFYNFTFRPVEEKEPEPETVSYTLNIRDAAGYNDPTEKCKSTATWETTSIPAGNYNVSYKAKCTSTDHTDRKWYNMATAGEETRPNNPDTVDQDPFRYFIKVADTTFNPTSTKSWGEEGLTITDYNVAKDVITNVTVPTDGAKVELCHGNIGFSLYFDSIIFTPMA